MSENSTIQLATIKYDAESGIIYCSGSWSTLGIAELAAAWPTYLKSVKQTVILDGSNITQFDTSGAWLLEKINRFLVDNNKNVQLQSFSKAAISLHHLVQEQLKPVTDDTDIIAYQYSFVEKCGQYTFYVGLAIVSFLQLFGEVCVATVKSVTDPKRIQWPLLLKVVETAGYKAMPIIALLSFLIGVVLAYQMGGQLKEYGASIYIADLLGVSVLREFGPLLTAIIVAGRTGAAFTAQIGTMKINEEIDAIRTMGLSPLDFLVLPKIFAMLIALPLLTLLADFAGVLGGMIMSKAMFDIEFVDFLRRFQESIGLDAYVFGLVKAPVFAVIISVVGCYQGLMVQGSATSVGVRTTMSVVQSIFLIIIADAFFSISYGIGGV